MTSIGRPHPHEHKDDRSPQHLGWQSAETIRMLVHLTRQTGFTEPAEAYQMIAALAATTHALPQLLRQTAGWLQTQHAAGAVRADHTSSGTGDAGEITAAAARHLLDAERTATCLAVLLDNAGQHLADLATGQRR